MTRQYGVKARLKSGGETIDITDFTLEVPARSLGAQLSASLAAFSPVLEESLSITFEIGIEKGDDSDWAMMMSDGQLLNRDDATRIKADQTKIKAISKLEGLWKLTPRVPLTLYDPAQVDIVTLTSQNRGDVVDSNGLAIEPIYAAINALDLNQLLQFIYVEKLGFGQVVTNILNYPLPRADFGLTTPYQSVAASQVALFDPEYSSESLERVFIVDPQGTLPTGFPSQVRSCPPGSYLEFQKTKQTATEINAVLLTYSVSTSTADVEPTERVIQDPPQITGNLGDDDCQRTIRTRFLKEWHDPNSSDRITRSITYKTETRVSAKADGLTREVSIETEEDHYLYDWRLNVGYTKTLQLYIKLPSELVAGMRTIQTETCQINYVATSDPSELIKTGQVIDVNGGVVFDGDLFDPALNSQFKQSLYDANKDGNITDDLQVRFSTPISSRIEQFRELGTDQILVSYQEIDHLTGGKPKRNGTIPHTGTLRVRMGQQDRQAKQTMLLRDEASEAIDGTLPPAALDAGDIPFPSALELGNRVLARHGQQPQRVSIQLGGLDLALRRGSLRRVSDRAGNTYLVFITGYTIEGKFAANEFGVSQSAEGVVLQEL